MVRKQTTKLKTYKVPCTGPWELCGMVWEWKERKLLRIEYEGREMYLSRRTVLDVARMQKDLRRQLRGKTGRQLVAIRRKLQQRGQVKAKRGADC
jgi:hypothetical protein